MEDTVLHAIALLRDLEAVCSSDSLDSDTVTSLPYYITLIEIRKRILELGIGKKTRSPGAANERFSLVWRDASLFSSVGIDTPQCNGHNVTTPTKKAYKRYVLADGKYNQWGYERVIELLILGHFVEDRESTALCRAGEKRETAARRELASEFGCDVEHLYDVYYSNTGYLLVMGEVGSPGFLACIPNGKRTNWENRIITKKNAPAIVKAWRSNGSAQWSSRNDSAVTERLEKVFELCGGGDREQLYSKHTRLSKYLRGVKDDAVVDGSDMRDRELLQPVQDESRARHPIGAPREVSARQREQEPGQRLNRDVGESTASGASIGQPEEVDCRGSACDTSSQDRNTADATFISISGQQNTARGSIARQDTRGTVRRREDPRVGSADQVAEGHNAVHKRRRVGNGLAFGQQPNGSNGLSAASPASELDPGGVSMDMSQGVHMVEVDAGNATLKAADFAVYSYSSALGILDGTRRQPRDMTSQRSAGSLDPVGRTSDDSCSHGGVNIQEYAGGGTAVGALQQQPVEESHGIGSSGLDEMENGGEFNFDWNSLFQEDEFRFDWDTLFPNDGPTTISPL